MPSLTGRSTRTLTGYVVTLLEYPRWVIERDVDFTDCHLHGSYEVEDTRCVACQFGAACCWLNVNRATPSPNAPLDELVQALRTAVDYLRASISADPRHARHCECETCQWLHEANGFLRMQRHKG